MTNGLSIELMHPLHTQSEKQMHNHQQSRAHRKMVEDLQAEFGEELDDVLGVLEEGEGEMEDPDLLGAEAEAATGAAAAVGEEGAALTAPGVGAGDEEDPPAATGEDAPPSPPEEESEEESSEDEDMGQVGRAMNRFAFGDDSTSDED